MDARTPLAVAAVVIALASTGCSTQTAAPATSSTAAASAASSASPNDNVPPLDPSGWTVSTYDELTKVIAAQSGTGLPATFDMDNTLMARDVSEAALALAQEDRRLDPASIPEALVPPVVVDGKTVSVRDGVSTYYDAVMDSGPDDPYREFSTLPMIADMYTGHTVDEFVQLTSDMYANGAGAKEFATGKQETIAGKARPAVYPQMADLLGNLHAHGYDVWVVSAAIGWAARWMVLNAINPLIEAKYGKDAIIAPDHVVAVFNLMRDKRTGEFVSDRQLVTRGDDAYLRMDRVRLKELEILSLAGDLTSWRGGKAGVIAQHVTVDPVYLAAGDSFGDMEMMSLAKNRLVISRLNKPDLAKGYAAAIKASPDATWLSQPVISSAPIGFVPDRCALDKKTANDPKLQNQAQESLNALEPTGVLASFDSC